MVYDECSQLMSQFAELLRVERQKKKDELDKLLVEVKSKEEELHNFDTSMEQDDVAWSVCLDNSYPTDIFQSVSFVTIAGSRVNDRVWQSVVKGRKVLSITHIS